MTFCIMTISLMTFSIMTISLMTFSIMNIIVTLSKNNSLKTVLISIEYNYAECCIFLVLCWVSLCWMSLCWVMWRQGKGVGVGVGIGGRDGGGGGCVTFWREFVPCEHKKLEQALARNGFLTAAEYLIILPFAQEVVVNDVLQKV